MRKQLLGLSTFLTIATLSLIFQNCAQGLSVGGNFESVACSGSNCLTTSTVTDLSSLSDSAAATPSSQLLNVVHGGGKAACEQFISDQYGKVATCSLGGGCGLSCGKSGGSCPSANPQHYGICISQAELAQLPATSTNSVPSAQLYNFVSGMGKASCEKLVADRFGKQATCSVGGGCGISCGKPGGSCASANPSHYGVCLSESDIAALPAKAAPQLYNFVSGMGKASCESLVQQRLGVSVSCKVGGGCGVSCGMPSASCPSANPSHYGACVYQ